MSKRVGDRVFSPHPLVEQLTAMRIQAGYTQKALAEMVGVSQSMVSDLETGKVSPTLITLSKYLDFWGGELKILKGQS